MELKQCPFCGHIPVIQLCDNEGNFRPLRYLENPYSGVSYALRHDYVDCPVRSVDGEVLGGILYENLDELEKAWNRRAGMPWNL